MCHTRYSVGKEALRQRWAFRISASKRSRTMSATTRHALAPALVHSFTSTLVRFFTRSLAIFCSPFTVHCPLSTASRDPNHTRHANSVYSPESTSFARFYCVHRENPGASITCPQRGAKKMGGKESLPPPCPWVFLNIPQSNYCKSLVTSCSTWLAWASAAMPVWLRISYFDMFEVAAA